MILEHAIFPIQPGQSKAFEAAFAIARRHLESAKGFHKLEMRACIERGDSYLLLVWWDSVEAHTQGFRQSPAFIEWRGLLGSYFAAPPEVHHYAKPL